MSDISDKLGGAIRPERATTEEQVRTKLLKLSSALADKAEGADDPTVAQIYAETAAVVFDAARARPRTEGDPPPTGG